MNLFSTSLSRKACCLGLTFFVQALVASEAGNEKITENQRKALPPTVSDSTDEVIAAEYARRNALLEGDVVSLDRLLSSDLLYVHSNGKHETKQDVITGFETKQVAYEQFDLSHLAARVASPEVIILTGSIHQRKFAGGKWREVELLFHAVWRLEGEQWKLFSIQTVQTPR